MLVTDAGAWVRALDEGPEGSVRARLRREAYIDARTHPMIRCSVELAGL